MCSGVSEFYFDRPESSYRSSQNLVHVRSTYGVGWHFFLSSSCQIQQLKDTLAETQAAFRSLAL